ncbi:MAG TPA: hypothetical protein VG916_08110 [Gemmatimonadaceae bacterium]|nr:hypothetical protein [Gemmatimonadaceae bacterium]
MTSGTESLDTVRARAEAFVEEISREVLGALTGMKPGADLQPLYRKHAAAFGDEAMEAVRSAFAGAAPGSDTARSARVLLEWVIDSRIGRELAPLDERDLAWEATAKVTLPDGTVEPYQRVAITLSNTLDAPERRVIDDARATLVAAELAPLKREKLEREREMWAASGVAAGYIPTFESLAGFSLADLRDQCAAFLRDTQAMWDDVLPHFLKARLNLAPADAARCDAGALFRAREFDGAFPADAMEREVRRHVTDMGASPDANGRVRYDTADREGKRARAFCAPVRIPEEVHLVIRPHGGQNDWMTLLHELGHALHFANAERTLPFEFRWMGDNSVTEGYAMLFDHRLKDAGWLQRYTGLGKAGTAEFLRSAGFEELHFLRRYCGKLAYELELYGGNVSWESLPGVYVETLTAATNFRYRDADAFVDVDPRFYAARYLRAWQLQALLAETLTERFNEDWWRNPAAGPWIVGELFSHGQRELGHEQAQRVSGKPLGFAPLVRSIERMLG